MNKKGSTHITWNDRLTIEKMLKVKDPKAKIAEAIGVCERTLYYELARGKCVQQTTDYEFVERYCADVAERKYQEHLREKGPDIKLGNDHKFAKKVEELIVDHGFSPAAALKAIEADEEEYSTDICKSTLYNCIYRRDVFLILSPEHLRKRENATMRSTQEAKRKRQERHAGRVSSTGLTRSTTGRHLGIGKWTVWWVR